MAYRSMDEMFIDDLEDSTEYEDREQTRFCSHPDGELA